MAVVGVDEAGKGPVLGSMFTAAVRWPADYDPPPGLADSKQLTPEQRAAIADRLRRHDRVEYAYAEVPVARIDDPETDMNALTVNAHAEALVEVAQPGDLARCDAADVDPARYSRRLQETLQQHGLNELVARAEHQADERHAVVSAASVLAKVARDTHVQELAAEYGAVGSGYPNDPTTQAFLEEFVSEHGRLPDCARRSWETSRQTLADAEQAGLGEF